MRQTRRLAARVGLRDGTDLGALYRAVTGSARAAGLSDDGWTLSSAGTSARPDETGTEDGLRRLESRLAEVWCDVLGRDRVGLDDNFFDLGGNSLLLVTAQTAVNRALDSDLSVVDLFAHPTVRDLARHLSATGAGPVPDAEAPSRPETGDGLDRVREQARRQRAARARRTARQGKDRGHA